jgi:hypothetical protein
MIEFEWHRQITGGFLNIYAGPGIARAGFIDEGRLTASSHGEKRSKHR